MECLVSSLGFGGDGEEEEEVEGGSPWGEAREKVLGRKRVASWKECLSFGHKIKWQEGHE